MSSHDSTRRLYLLRQTISCLSGGRLSVVQITVLGNFHVIENDRVLLRCKFDEYEKNDAPCGTWFVTSA
jgi:hypothetical protein